MKNINIKGQKGAVTLLVLVTMLFFVTFLTSTYLILSNKAQSEIEITEQTRKIYEADEEAIYSSFFGDSVVPIYTVEQLLAIGSNKNIPISELGGKIYYFSKDATYVFMNNLEFSSEDWVPIGQQYQEDSTLTGRFDGNGKTITVSNSEWGTYQFNASNNYKYMITTGPGTEQTEAVFAYTGDVQTFTAPVTGYYNLQVWGAQGGYRSSTTSAYGGKGGYSEGEVYLTEGEMVYIYVGGSGNTGGSSGGFNGGGARPSSSYPGGGGATDIRLSADTLYNRVIVAGGGRI